MSTAREAAFKEWLSINPSHPCSQQDDFNAGWDARELAMETTVFALAVHSASDATPEQIYAAYPLKVGKQAAIKAIKKALKDTHMKPQALLDATQAFAAAVAQWPEAEKKYIPHPATFFNAGRYDDDQSAWVKGKPIYQSQFGQSH